MTSQTVCCEVRDIGARGGGGAGETRRTGAPCVPPPPPPMRQAQVAIDDRGDDRDDVDGCIDVERPLILYLVYISFQVYGVRDVVLSISNIAETESDKGKGRKSKEVEQVSLCRSNEEEKN